MNCRVKARQLVGKILRVYENFNELKVYQFEFAYKVQICLMGFNQT